MASYRRPFEIIASVRQQTAALRQQEHDNTVRQFVRVGELDADVVGADQVIVGGPNGVIIGGPGQPPIEDGAVGNSELADNAVGPTKIGPNSVQTHHLVARNVTSDRMQVGGVGGTEMADGGVGTIELANGAVTASKASIGQLSALSADLGVVTAGLIQGPTIQTAASGVRTILDTGGLRLMNSAAGSDTWSSAQWFLTDGSAVSGAIRCQLPQITGTQFIRQEVSAFLAGIAEDVNTSCQISVRATDGALLGRVQVFGNGNVVVSDTPTVSSDARLKDQIEMLGESLPAVRRLKPRTYKRKGNGHRQIGFVAQEVREVFPATVHEIPPTPEDPEPTLGIQYEAIIPPVVRATQELADKLDALSERMGKLEKR